ncbi:MAG: hypothetical protein ACI4WS_08455 [Oscillospiraceae bacterium]
MRIVDEILDPTREQELVCQTHIKQIDMLHRIIERFGKHGGSRENMREILRKLALEEEQLNRGIDSLLDYREPALKYINQLKGDEYTVIYRYYIIGQTWEKIAAEIYFSERKVFLIRHSALNKLEKIYNSEVQNG